MYRQVPRGVLLLVGAGAQGSLTRGEARDPLGRPGPFCPGSSRPPAFGGEGRRITGVNTGDPQFQLDFWANKAKSKADLEMPLLAFIRPAKNNFAFQSS